MPAIRTKNWRQVQSRIYFKLQRSYLTRPIRWAIHVGLPLIALFCLTFVWLHSGDNYGKLVTGLEATIDGVLKNPEYAIEGLEIESGSAQLSAELGKLLPSHFPISPFEIDPAELKETIEELPAVRAASILLEPGGMMKVSVVEWKPAVVWRNGESLVLLNEAGKQLQVTNDRFAHGPLPLVVGDGADTSIPEAIEIFEAAKEVRHSIRGLVRIGERRWNLVLDGDRTIALPAENPVKAVERVMTFESRDAVLQREFVVLDARIPGRTTLRAQDDPDESRFGIEVRNGGNL